MHFHLEMIYEQLAKSYLARSKSQTECSEILLNQLASYQELGQHSAASICAASLHVNMLSHDLMALLLLHGLTDDKWANRTAARMIATVIYEGAVALQHIFGKPFRDACQDLGILAEFDTELRRIKGEMASFQEAHEPEMKAMRMTAGAHRDHDIVTFLSSFLDESKTTAVVAASVELEGCLRNWGAFSAAVMKRVSNVLKS